MPSVKTARNPAESAASVKSKLKESREKEEECTRNLKEKQLQLVQARKEAVNVIYTHHRVVLRLNEEISKGAEDLVNVQSHYRTEREKLLSGFVGDLLRKIREKEGTEDTPVTVPIPYVPKYVVPRHTPDIRCFLPEHLTKPGSYHCTLKIAECEEFMTLTNQDRLELLFSQRRCFGCFLPISVAGHNTLPDCRILGAAIYADLETIIRSSVAFGALTRGSCRKTTERGPAVTYGAALTGRIAKPVDSRHEKIGLVHNTANGGAETRQRKIGSITEPVPQLGGSISGPVLYPLVTFNDVLRSESAHSQPHQAMGIKCLIL
ncbi:hypothetical protein OUZ56_017285 [Daphnia magna]|uniref:Uncharacterized protein n=1 Tax=Daphnia magna TaxID=35525 RepID=A0ABR0ASK8_9CRUS|nr:hypothetical protein OUZ56_017285 [Daphnia magna]